MVYMDENLSTGLGVVVAFSALGTVGNTVNIGRLGARIRAIEERVGIDPPGSGSRATTRPHLARRVQDMAITARDAMAASHAKVTHAITGAVGRVVDRITDRPSDGPVSRYT